MGSADCPSSPDPPRIVVTMRTVRARLSVPAVLGVLVLVRNASGAASGPGSSRSACTAATGYRPPEAAETGLRVHRASAARARSRSRRHRDLEIRRRATEPFGVTVAGCPHPTVQTATQSSQAVTRKASLCSLKLRHMNTWSIPTSSGIDIHGQSSESEYGG